MLFNKYYTCILLNACLYDQHFTRKKILYNNHFDDSEKLRYLSTDSAHEVCSVNYFSDRKFNEYNIPTELNLPIIGN